MFNFLSFCDLKIVYNKFWFDNDMVAIRKFREKFYENVPSISRKRWAPYFPYPAYKLFELSYENLLFNNFLTFLYLPSYEPFHIPIPALL
jgi:hypothetical protein